LAKTGEDTMAKAQWNGTTIASSDACLTVEGNVYFPPDGVDTKFLVPSETTTECSWKGTASYYDVVVDGKRNADAAWYYRSPKKEAENIAGYVAFWKGVDVEA
jgi:uncharacterized protein (DUF427 family)